jgi:23S rRNA-/tRNA-specific pseudouridylate synthase
MAFVGAPIVGDPVYGQADERLLLHAYELEITIPGSPNQRRTFGAPLPAEFSEKFPDARTT